MVERNDKDRLVRAPAATGAPAAKVRVATLPTSEPGGRSLAEQRADLQRVLYEVEGSLQYMGAAHPQRRATEAKRAQLVEMLRQLEAALGHKPHTP